MKKNIFLIAAGTLLFISCNKSVDEPAPGIHINFSKQAFAYVQIPPNKYYIYKDSATGETDSVVVTQSTLENNQMPSRTYVVWGIQAYDPPYNYQTFTLLLSKVNGNISTDWFYGIANSNDLPRNQANTDTAGLWLRERNRLANSDKMYVFCSPFTNSNNQTIIPTLTIEGKDYSDVVKFSGNNGITPSNPNYTQYYWASTYYWAKGTGIIKRSITTANGTQTWTLVRNG